MSLFIQKTIYQYSMFIDIVFHTGEILQRDLNDKKIYLFFSSFHFTKF